MTETARLALPLIAEAQAQKHITHNEALLKLDVLVQMAVMDRDLTAPPDAPSEGDAWIVAAGATGDWAGHDGEVAAWQGGVWRFHAPRAGWIAWVEDEQLMVLHDGSGWRRITGVDAVSLGGHPASDYVLTGDLASASVGDADTVDGHHAEEFAPLSGATFTGGVTAAGFTGDGGGLTNVNADYLGGQSADAYMLRSDLASASVGDADTVDGHHAEEFALLSGATFTGGVTLPMLGVQTSASGTNRMAVKSDAVLFSHDDVSGDGSGDVRVILNKAAEGRTASFLFQDNWSGRAEFGLTGNDDFSLKVSADGATWREVLILASDGAAGFPHMPADNLLINGDLSVNQRGFAGGALAEGTYGYDRWRGGPGGADVRIEGDEIVLTGAIEQIVEGVAGGVALHVSVEALSGGGLDVTVGDVTARIDPGAGRRGVRLSAPAAGGNVLIRLASATQVRFRRILAAYGPGAAIWRPRPAWMELELCRRYFQRLSYATYEPIAAGGLKWDRKPMLPLRWPAMRAAPAITFHDGGVSDPFLVYIDGSSVRTGYDSMISVRPGGGALALSQIGSGAKRACFVRNIGNPIHFDLEAEV